MERTTDGFWSGCGMFEDLWPEVYARRYGVCALLLMLTALAVAHGGEPFDGQHEYAAVVRGAYPWNIIVITLLVAAGAAGFRGRRADEYDRLAKSAIALAAFFLVTLLLGINTPWYFVGIGFRHGFLRRSL